MRKMNCCIDDWWPEIVGGVRHAVHGGFSCPADLSCNN
jgi:hypothetical protein